MKKKNYRGRASLTKILGLALTLAVLAMVVYGLRQTRRSVQGEDLRLAEQSVRRAAVVCYSIESRYPDSFEYLAENYGLGIDLGKYDVHYEIFASNIMPDITVVKR